MSASASRDSDDEEYAGAPRTPPLAQEMYEFDPREYAAAPAWHTIYTSRPRTMENIPEGAPFLHIIVDHVDDDRRALTVAHALRDALALCTSESVVKLSVVARQPLPYRMWLALQEESILRVGDPNDIGVVLFDASEFAGTAVTLLLTGARTIECKGYPYFPLQLERWRAETIRIIIPDWGGGRMIPSRRDHDSFWVSIDSDYAFPRLREVNTRKAREYSDHGQPRDH